MELKIYKNQTEVIKTYKCEHYDITWGTVNKVLALFDLENMTDGVALLKVISQCRAEINTVLMDMFPEITEEELERVKIKDLIPLIEGIFGFSFKELVGIFGKN